MRDYVYPSIYFAYFCFFLLLVGALFFFFRTLKQGYWGAQSEEAKYQMLEDDEGRAPHTQDAKQKRS